MAEATYFVRRLLQAGADVNQISPDGLTALHAAIACGYVDVVEELCAAGADVNLSGRGRTPLFIAAERGNTAIVSILLRHGADVEI